ncbi:hypothetical protein ACFQJC_11505 [Haloferax namakaokahaiae]|uniref:TFIIB-type domain-containing protein n=1 Tax=Haloferax namakaokahaiae TaxID=1748331 RepID=A0ABD5ZFQ3_9EURY
MSFEWVSYFHCRNCGLAKSSVDIPYDRLGYAVCPACGVTTGPTVRKVTSELPAF